MRKLEGAGYSMDWAIAVILQVKLLTGWHGAIASIGKVRDCEVWVGKDANFWEESGGVGDGATLYLLF